MRIGVNEGKLEIKWGEMLVIMGVCGRGKCTLVGMFKGVVEGRFVFFILVA
ncbi:hypothetical protein [Priestia megaterium]|uniref:hypothetical protein n=1 Tax=Priestia megaterium TaxID=1404 RepID=UPI001649B757|nr:hypothetical protein [Priestia megaterium]